MRAVRAQIHRQIFPHVAYTVTYNKQPVADQVRAGVGLYFFVYLSTFLAFALALGFTGLSFVESIGASATALGGVGPGLGGAIGPCCTFAPFRMRPSGCSRWRCWPAGWRSSSSSCR